MIADVHLDVPFLRQSVYQNPTPKINVASFLVTSCPVILDIVSCVQWLYAQCKWTRFPLIVYTIVTKEGVVDSFFYVEKKSTTSLYSF